MNGIAGPLISLQFIWIPLLGGRMNLDELYCLSQARVHTRDRLEKPLRYPRLPFGPQYREGAAWHHESILAWASKLRDLGKLLHLISECFLTKNKNNSTILQSCLENCVCNAWKWLDYSHSIISVPFPLRIQNKDTCQVKVIILSLPWHQQWRKERKKRVE